LIISTKASSHPNLRLSIRNGKSLTPDIGARISWEDSLSFPILSMVVSGKE